LKGKKVIAPTKPAPKQRIMGSDSEGERDTAAKPKSSSTKPNQPKKKAVAKKGTALKRKPNTVAAPVSKKKKG
jgi:hypothetical protein